MKRIIICLCALIFLLTGCDALSANKYTTAEMKAVEPVGTVPKAFQAIVNENLFHNIRAFENRLMKFQQNDDGYTITMYDYTGNLLASYSRMIDTYVHPLACMLATFDGGFLVAFGFYDHYDSNTNTWASENGVDSIIVKLDSQGNIQWEQKLKDYTSLMLGDCFERDDGYYFIGEQETPETKVTGVGSRTDLHFLKMSKDGEILDTKIIGGSDFDSVCCVDTDDNNQFILYCFIQSNDGDFIGIHTDDCFGHKVVVNDAFELLSVESVNSFPHDKIGRINGKTIYSNSKEFDKFNAGSPTAILDYDDFYLVVSENIIGEYEHTPLYISSRWYYTETVYSAYSKEGKLLWRAAKDSSLDFEALLEELNTTAVTQ
jgi:hypothetical protein